MQENNNSRCKNITTSVFLVPFLVSLPLTPSWTSYPIVLLIALLCRTRISLKEQNGLVIAIMLLLVTSIFRPSQYSVNMAKDLGLMIIGIMPFLFKSQFEINASRLNWLLIGGFFISAGANIAGYRMDTDAFIESTFGIELGALCYTFSLLALYWLKKGGRIWFIINCLLAILCGKRIAFASIVVCALIHIIFRKKEGEVPIWLKILIMGVTIIVLLFTYFFTYGYLDDVIFDTTGKSADAFTMGRQQLYSIAFSMIELPNLWGIGPGNTVETIKNLYGVGGRMHNDFLKIFTENGIILYLVFFYILIRKLKYKQLPTLCLIMSLFLTTNTLIYVYMLFLYVIFLDSDKYIISSNSRNKWINPYDIVDRMSLKNHY